MGAPTYYRTESWGWVRKEVVARVAHRTFAAHEGDASPLAVVPRAGCDLCRLSLDHTEARCLAEAAPTVSLTYEGGASIELTREEFCRDNAEDEDLCRSVRALGLEEEVVRAGGGAVPAVTIRAVRR